MFTWLHKRLRREEGFTLIELLVVILIIGILAAIAIPAFLNQKGKGEDANAKAMARETQTALETYYTDHNDYGCNTGTTCATALAAIEPTLWPIVATGTTPAVGQQSVTISSSAGGTNDQYSITSVSKPSGRTYTINKVGGVVTRTCTATASNAGGCKDVGVNGNAAGNGSW
jgi:type IV pilus assembly protein PilA